MEDSIRIEKEFLNKKEHMMIIDKNVNRNESTPISTFDEIDYFPMIAIVSPFIIEKDNIESDNEKIRRIINKFSSPLGIDKSPPMSFDLTSSMKILNDRKYF